MRARSVGVGAVLALLVVACASAKPSQQLLDARSVISRASSGPASEFAPKDLLAARQLLDQSEKSADGSAEEIHFAYLADREGRRAEARGTKLHDEDRKKETELEFAALQESGRLSAESRLDKSRKDLAEIEVRLKDRDADVVALGRRKEELLVERERLSGNLTNSEEALAASEKARVASDARAAAALASLSSLANVREEGNETIITLSGQVLFATGNATLLPIAKDSLGRVAQALGEVSSDRRVIVKGHTDSQGGNASNQRLSEERANAVMRYLTGAGIDAKRLSAVGVGEEEPVTTNDTAEGRANNRRVELVIGQRLSASASGTR